MTRLLSKGQADLLRLLAQIPLLDRLEMAALAGRSRGGVYESAARLEDAGLIDSVPHGTPLLAPTRRYYLTEPGVKALAVAEVRPLGRLLREYPLSLRFRRTLLERLDAAAVIYRLASALAGLDHPLDFRWRRALPQDADVCLPDWRVLAMVRQGGTAERAGFAKRLWRLAQGPRPSAVLVMVPDEVRLRQAVALLRDARRQASPAPAFFALERHVAVAGSGDPIWRSSAGVTLSLAEAVGRANPGGMTAAEPLLVRVSIPKDIDLSGGSDEIPDHLLPVLLRPAEKRALDLLADWPWLTREDLSGLLDVSRPRASQLTAVLERLGLATGFQLDARRLALTDRGLKLLARRDRVSTGEARQRWSVSRENDGGIVSGRRSRQLLRDLEHTAAVHRFVAALNRQAKGLGWDVEQLDPPHRASRYFRHYGGPRALHPDAFGTLRRDDLLRPFFLEYERRAVRPATMAQRLAPYLRYYSSHRPTDDHGHRPLVLVVFDDPVAPTHFLEVARREMLRVRVPLPLLVSHRELLEREGPLGPAWLEPGGNFKPVEPLHHYQ
ncbi:MAG: replication-relaxation family protein [Chloroflexota bacterium]|nr:replication-relaxation family protein [Chloroflexota bacterium]